MIRTVVIGLLAVAALVTSLVSEPFVLCLRTVPLPCEFLPSRDLLTLAQFVAGAALFVGMQSAPYAIAEGLKMPTILHGHSVERNCFFCRADATVVL